MSESSSMSEWKKILILVMGLLEILIFSGTILGWTSLKLMLKKEGIYDYKCQGLNINTNYTKTTSRLVLPTNVTTTTTDQYANHQNKTQSSMVAMASTMTTMNATNLSTTSEKKLPSTLALANFSVLFNFTIDDGSGHWRQDDKVKSSSSSSSPPIGNKTGNHRTIVIPFHTNQTLNQSFIYTLLRDQTVTLRLNRSETELNLFTDPVEANEANNSTNLEKFIHLYMAENLEPAHTLSDSCSEQEVTLNLAFSIGSFNMGAAAFIWGFLLEKWGLRIVRLLINLMISIGAFLLCFTAKGHDWLLFPAILIMSLGGVPIRIANMQFSNLYPSKRSTIISVYSGAFSASSIIYVILQHIYSATEISFFWVNFILVFLSLLMIPFTLFVLPKHKIVEPTSSSAKVKPLTTVAKPTPLDHNHNPNSTEQTQLSNSLELPPPPPPLEQLFARRKSTVFAISKITLQNYKFVHSPMTERKNGFVNHSFVDDELPKLKGDDDDMNGKILNGFKSEKSMPIVPVVPDAAPVSPPLKVSLYSFAYNLHQLWFSWMITYMLMYVGSMNMWTERVTTDKAKQSTFLNIYGLAQVLALVVSPLAGLLMDWQLAKASRETDPLERQVKRVQSGFWPLFITTITLLICVLCHYFDTQEMIYLSIVFITIYRAFLLAVGSAFLRVRFHGDHFNRLLGIMSSVSAVTSLLQIPLFKWESSSQSNVLYVNIFNTVVAFLVMSNPLYLLIVPLQRYFIRKENQQLAKCQ